MNKAVIVIVLGGLSFYACQKEEPVLPQEALYFDEIVDEFYLLDPCDTILAPAYQLTRAFDASSEISRLFYLQQPRSELVLLGKAATDLVFQDNRMLYLNGLSVADEQLGEPVFVLSESEVELDLFAVDNIYLIGKASSFENRYLFLSSSDALATNTMGVRDLFKVRLYEVEEDQGTITVRHKLQLNATISEDDVISYTFESRLLPDNEETQIIQDAIAEMRTGSYVFDPTTKVKTIDLQLELYQRDFPFAQGLLKDTNFLNLLSEESQDVLSVLDRMVAQKSITAFFCLSDQKIWKSRAGLASNIPTPLD
ncbi:MAG: hypothetical protein Sapg2KO_44680 [Saprospiraceae bacterium]